MTGDLHSICCVHRASSWRLLLQGKIAKWWIPEDVVFVDEIPHTAAGKIYKLQLRKNFKDYKFPASKL